MTIFDDAAAEGARLYVLVETLRAETQAAIEAGQTAQEDLDAALARIAELEALLATYAPLIDGGDLQTELDRFPEGATVRLAGDFTVSRPVSPKPGMTLVGFATVRPKLGVSVLDGFALKGYDGVTLDNVEVSGFDRHGILLGLGSTIVRSKMTHNGKDGAGADLEGADGPAPVIDTCTIALNGSDEWLGKGAAGVKMFHTRRFVMLESYVHHNVGNGVWADAHCGDFTVMGSTIEANTRKGIFYEKCGASSIRGVTYEGALHVESCDIIGNATAGRDLADAGLSIISSKNATVKGNTFGGTVTGDGIRIRQDPARDADDKPGWTVENVTIEGNALRGDALVGCDLPGVTCLDNSP